jgi:hypothetical protein
MYKFFISHYISDDGAKISGLPGISKPLQSFLFGCFEILTVDGLPL